MLNSVRSKIDEIDNLKFSEFYLEYVINTQDDILLRDLKRTRSLVTSVEHITEADTEINTMFKDFLNEII